MKLDGLCRLTSFTIMKNVIETYIVSAMVLAANNSKPRHKRRGDLVAPATGHPDCIRENGFIVSVPGFVR